MISSIGSVEALGEGRGALVCCGSVKIPGEV